MPFTASYAQKVLTNVINSNTEVGLLNSSNIELSGGGYQRSMIGSLDLSKSAQISNKNIIFMFESTGPVGTASKFGLYSGSTLMFVGDLGKSLTITSGYVPLIRPGQLVIGLDKDDLEYDESDY